MPRPTINGKLAYSRAECLRGDGGPELQAVVRDMCELVGFNSATEEREYRNLIAREREQRKKTHAAKHAAQAFDSEGERARLRQQMFNRVR